MEPRCPLTIEELARRSAPREPNTRARTSIPIAGNRNRNNETKIAAIKINLEVETEKHHKKLASK